MPSPAPAFRRYADFGVRAVECLARAVLRLPTVASNVNGGGCPVGRSKMIASERSNRPKSFWLRACVLLCTLVLLPLCVTHAQDYKAVGKRLEEAVAKGEITKQQAAAMLTAYGVKTRPAVETTERTSFR